MGYFCSFENVQWRKKNGCVCFFNVVYLLLREIVRCNCFYEEILVGLCLYHNNKSIRFYQGFGVEQEHEAVGTTDFSSEQKRSRNTKIYSIPVFRYVYFLNLIFDTLHYNLY